MSRFFVFSKNLTATPNKYIIVYNIKIYNEVYYGYNSCNQKQRQD